MNIIKYLDTSLRFGKISCLKRHPDQILYHIKRLDKFIKSHKKARLIIFQFSDILERYNQYINTEIRFLSDKQIKKYGIPYILYPTLSHEYYKFLDWNMISYIEQYEYPTKISQRNAI
jgi:hypothetical protein